MQNVIETKNLTKMFGKFKAVDDIALIVNKGEIYGFLGLNGAGKQPQFVCCLELVCFGVPGIAPYFPWAFPALFSGITGQAIPPPCLLSYIIFGITVVFGFRGTAYWWRFADQT
jgi:hypothetical protein